MAFGFIGRLFCERSILIWKIYFCLLVFIFSLLMYNTYNFTVYVSEQFHRYTWYQRKIQYLPNGSPTALLSLQVDLMVKYDSMKKDQWNFSKSEFEWCPDLTGTSLEHLFDNTSDLLTEPPACSAIFSKEPNSTELAKNWRSPCVLTDSQVASLGENCETLKRVFRFDSNLYESELRYANFSLYPLAFVVLAGEKNAQQFYRLMSTIYRPWNAYCLTYDDDSSTNFKQAIANFDRCFSNIIMPQKFFRIKWASFTILESSMECLKLLNDYDALLPWQYVQFVSWNDFPLRTMPEMVEIAKILNGSQDVELTRGQIERYERYHTEAALDESRRGQVKPVPPGDLVIYKGSMAATLSRQFVHFLFSNLAARQFFDWCRTTFAAEEQFWSTLAHNLHLGAPGAFTAACLPYYEYKRKSKNKPFISRHQVWYKNCAGKLTSGSCVFGIGDLHKLILRPEIFAHKLYSDFEPATYYCMSQWYYEKSLMLFVSDQAEKSGVVDWFSNEHKLRIDYYRDLPGVRYHNLVDKSNFTC